MLSLSRDSELNELEGRLSLSFNFLAHSNKLLPSHLFARKPQSGSKVGPRGTTTEAVC